MVFAGAVVVGLVLGVSFYARYHRVKPHAPAAIAGGVMLTVLIAAHFALEEMIVVRDVSDMGGAFVINLLVNLVLVGGVGVACFFTAKRWIKKRSKREIPASQD